MTTFYALKTGEKVNPATGEGSPYYTPAEQRQALYIVSAGSGPVKAISSHEEGSTDEVGKNVLIYWQYPSSNDRRRYVTVVGIVTADGVKSGNVPAKPVAHWVMK